MSVNFESLKKCYNKANDIRIKVLLRNSIPYMDGDYIVLLKVSFHGSDDPICRADIIFEETTTRVDGIQISALVYAESLSEIVEDASEFFQFQYRRSDGILIGESSTFQFSNVIGVMGRRKPVKKHLGTSPDKNEKISNLAVTYDNQLTDYTNIICLILNEVLRRANIDDIMTSDHGFFHRDPSAMKLYVEELFKRLDKSNMDRLTTEKSSIIAEFEEKLANAIKTVPQNFNKEINDLTSKHEQFLKVAQNYQTLENKFKQALNVQKKCFEDSFGKISSKLDSLSSSVRRYEKSDQALNYILDSFDSLHDKIDDLSLSLANDDHCYRYTNDDDEDDDAYEIHYS